jgi:hypothetical protein
MVGAADSSVDVVVTDPVEVAGESPEGAIPLLILETAEPTVDAAADEATAPPPPDPACPPISAPCWPCLFTGDHAQLVEVCSASAYILNVDKDIIVGITPVHFRSIEET